MRVTSARSVPILTAPTAAGKTSLAALLAHERGGVEIVSADAFLVYRGLNLGTAKPTLEERLGVPHWLLDVADVTESYDVARYVEAAQAAIADILERGKTPLVVGGTGFYLSALMGGLPLTPKSEPAARAALERSLGIHRDLENGPGIAHAALLLGNVAHSEGNLEAAQALYRESLSLNRTLSNSQKTGHALWCLARNGISQDDHAHVQVLLEECAALFRGMKDPWSLSAALALAGAAALQKGEYVQARPLLAEHLRLVEQMGMRRSAPWALRCLGRLAVDRREWARAARLLAAASGLESTPNIVSDPGKEGDVDALLSPEEAQAVAAARQALGAEAFAAACVEGQAMTLEQAVEDALSQEE